MSSPSEHFRVGDKVTVHEVMVTHRSPNNRPARRRAYVAGTANRRHLADESELMKELAAAAEPCFETADRLAVYCEMNLGGLPHAVDELISAVVRKDHPMPAVLIDGLREWLADDPIDDNGDFLQRLTERIARVRTK